jgi:hypothetical protein
MVSAVDEHELKRLWFLTDLSTTQIGDRLGVSRTTVRRIASRLRLPDREDIAARDDLSDLAELTVAEIWAIASDLRFASTGVRVVVDVSKWEDGDEGLRVRSCVHCGSGELMRESGDEAS